MSERKYGLGWDPKKGSGRSGRHHATTPSVHGGHKDHKSGRSARPGAAGHNKSSSGVKKTHTVNQDTDYEQEVEDFWEDLVLESDPEEESG